MPSILVIEDDPVSSALLAETLRASGHAVVEAANGRKAMAFFERDEFDLVITDLVMPEQEGMGTILAIRRLDLDIPIIAVSASSFGPESLNYLDIAVSLGASGALTKPLDWEKLSNMVERLIAQYRPAVKSRRLQG